jgi:two-component sensor histidine kinase
LTQFAEIIVTTLSPDRPVSEAVTLLRELNHRIDNQFASAISLISIEAVRAEGQEAKTALSNTVELLRGYGEVHRTLLMPQGRTLIDALKYLRELSAALRSALLDRLQIELMLGGDPLPLEPERCWRLGLIVHELVMNATEHACFDGRLGQIKVKLARTDCLINCVVSDNGSPVSRARHGQAHGLRIIGELAKGLGGRIEHGIGAEFRSVVLSFSLSERERSAIRAIDSRPGRRLCQPKIAATGARAKSRSKPSNQRSRPVAVPSAPASNLMAIPGSTSTPFCSADVLGELFSPSHRMDMS